MKKLFVLSLALLLCFGGVASAVDYGSVVKGGGQVTSGYHAGQAPGEIANQGKYISEPHRKFRFVRYVPPQPSTSTGTGGHILDLIASKDSVVIWSTSVSGDDGVTVTLSTTSQDTRIAGILGTDALPPISTDVVSGAQADIGKRNWAYLQTYGKATAFYNPGNGASTAGGAFGVSVITGEIGSYSVSPDAAGTDTASTTQLGFGGFFYDASPAGDNGAAVFLKCE